MGKGTTYLMKEYTGQKNLTQHGLDPVEVKFIYSEKATIFYEIFLLLLTVCTVVKSKGKISQNFVVFSEYMNSKFYAYCILCSLFSNMKYPQNSNCAKVSQESFKYSNLVATSLKRYCV